MRILKFRMWSKREKKMIYGREATSVSIFTPKFTYRINECEIMQYIGLEDINEKEIYEGDIVKTKYGIEIIKYFDKEARFKITNYSGGSDKISDYIYNGGLEVIGNIYEDKDLLRNGEE